MRVVLAGTWAGVPDQGGATWAVLQYVHGLRGLGHDVLLLEPTPAHPAVLACFRRVVRAHDLAGRAALLHGQERASGMSYREVADWTRGADMLINLGGVLVDAELTEPVALRVYVDLDPGFTQLWQAGGTDMRLAGHHRFATFGRAIGSPGCDVPTGGIEWIGTAPPVALDHWPAVDRPARYGFTTVANWRSYGSVTRDRVFYGQKAHAVRALVNLPSLVPGTAFDPAFAIDPGEQQDIAALVEAGWRLVDPVVAAGDPDRYRRFVQASHAEIGVAKSGYVLSRCGWFSDRSACYLASGRPVVAQDTGWPSFYPAGEGLLAFRSPDDAAEAVDEVVAAYDRHRKAARAVAEEFFNARKVLRRLLAAVGAET